jgi:hypothetical protein
MGREGRTCCSRESRLRLPVPFPLRAAHSPLHADTDTHSLRQVISTSYSTRTPEQTHAPHHPSQTHYTADNRPHCSSSVPSESRCTPSTRSVLNGRGGRRHGVSCSLSGGTRGMLVSTTGGEALVVLERCRRGTYHEIRVPSRSEPFPVSQVQLIQIPFQLLDVGKVVHHRQMSVRECVFQA